MEQEGCTTLIVTGDKVEGPNTTYDWGILIKNSDTSVGSRETPTHVAAQVGVSFEYQNGALEANHDTFTNSGNDSYAYTGAYAPDGNSTSSATSDGNVGGTTIIDISRTAGVEYPATVYNGYHMYITSGAANGEHSHVVSWNWATHEITVEPAFSAQIVSGVTYEWRPSPLPAAFTRVVFGQNETGLTVCHNQVLSPAPMVADGLTFSLRTNSLGLGGKELVTTMLAFYDDVDDIVTDLNTPDSILGQYNIRGAQNVSVIDNTGKGIAFEISPSKYVYKTVTNSFYANANVSRLWDSRVDNGEAPTVIDYDDSGNRSQYIVQGLTKYMNMNHGKLNYKDAIKYVGRYIHEKESGDQNYICNVGSFWDINIEASGGTYASMVGITGDTRYNGKLNCFWGEYGNIPMIGLYLPHNAYAGALPADGAGAWSDVYPNNFMYNHVEVVKWAAARTGSKWDPAKVTAIQDIAHVVEDYTFEQWEYILSSIESRAADDDLHFAELLVELNAFIDAAQQTGAATYRAGTTPVVLTYRSNPASRAGIVAYQTTVAGDPHPIIDWMTFPLADNTTFNMTFQESAEVDPADPCVLTVNITGPTVGGQACSVTLDPAGGSYTPGTVVTMTPVPGSFYQFRNWEGDLISENNPGTITMNGDKTVRCNFEYIVGVLAAKAAYFGVGFTAETWGIRVTSTWPTGGAGLDGNSVVAAANPFLTPYFYHGDGTGGTPLLGDYPVIHSYDDGMVIENCVVDDNGDNGSIWKPGIYAPSYIAIAIGFDGGSIINCTLNNCARYGIGTTSATDFYIGYNRVTAAQYCISGSGGMSTDGLVEFNDLRGMTRDGFKIRGWDTVTVKNNYVDITPTDNVNLASSVGFEFSTNVPNVVDVTCEHNVVSRKTVGNGQEAHGYAGGYTNVTNGTAMDNGNVGGTTIVDTGKIQANDYWNGFFMQITSGAASGERRTVTDWDKVSATFTVAPAFSVQITIGTNYAVFYVNTGNVVQNNIFYNIHRPGYLHGNPVYTGAPAVDYTITGNTFVYATVADVAINNSGVNNNAHNANNTFV